MIVVPDGTKVVLQNMPGLFAIYEGVEATATKNIGESGETQAFDVAAGISIFASENQYEAVKVR